jgi:ferritin
MNEKIEKAFNAQVNAEFYSAYLYLAMASHFAVQNLEGMATWMRIQVDEERLHAHKFVDFIIDRGGRVVLEQIDKPKTEWSSPLEAFRDALKHEQLVTQKINTLLELATKENDHAAATFLQWFVTEQVEEEKNVHLIISKLEFIKDNPTGLLLIDQQLGQRTAAATTAGTIAP